MKNDVTGCTYIKLLPMLLMGRGLTMTLEHWCLCCAALILHYAVIASACMLSVRTQMHIMLISQSPLHIVSAAVHAACGHVPGLQKPFGALGALGALEGLALRSSAYLGTGKDEPVDEQMTGL